MEGSMVFWLWRNVKKNLNAQGGFTPATLYSPQLRNPLKREYIIIALERRGGMGGRAPSPPSSYQCFVFHLRGKGILRARFFSLWIPVIRYHDSSGQKAAQPVWISQENPAIIIHESKIIGQKRTFMLIYTYTVDRNTKKSRENPS
jgi:hypothetical protein